MERFNGRSGKFYIENSFGQGKYDYAVYDSEKDFKKRSHLPNYVDSKTAFEDYEKTDLKRGYLFTIDVNGTLLKIETNVLGELVKPTEFEDNFKDYLKRIQAKHGRENITYQTEKIN